MKPPIIPLSRNRLSKPILQVGLFLAVFLLHGDFLFGNTPYNNLETSNFALVSDCAKGLAFPVYAGDVLDGTDVIPICAGNITGTNDVDFDMVSVLDYAGLNPPPAGNQYFLRYIINGMTITDPNVSSVTGGKVLSTSLEGATFPMEFDGLPNSQFNFPIQDDITMTIPSDFQNTATIQYSITVQLMEMTPTGSIVSQTCAPKGFVVTAEVSPAPPVTAALVNPVDTHACADQTIPLLATASQTGTNIQSFNWSVLSADPGFGGYVTDPFSATTNFIGTIDNNVVAKGQHGTVRVQVDFSDGSGCTSSDIVEIELFRAVGSLVCNDRVNISLNDVCSVEIEPDAVLEGSYGDYTLFEVMVFDRNLNIGNTVDGSHIGKNLTVRVIDQCSGNYCWGYLTVEDKFAPVIDCSASNLKTNIVTGTIDLADNRYHRSVAVLQGNAGSCILSPSVGTMTLYETTEFDITVGGDYVFEMVAAQEDMFGAIYAGHFNPGSACTNIVAADDDSALLPFGPKMTVNLTPGRYILVTGAHFNNGSSGYQWQIDGPPNAAGIPQGICSLNDTLIVACTLPLDSIPQPRAVDNCEGAIVPILLAESTLNFGCGRPDGTVEIITRTWQATDSRGNKSDICTQVIKKVRRNLTDVVFPDNYDDQTLPAFDCTDSISKAHPDSTGYPTLDGSPVVVGNSCMLNIAYTDLTLPVCGGGSKILREWTVLDWCEPLVAGVNPRVHTQLIKFIDKSAPDITCPTPFTVSANNNDCTANIVFPPATATDNCSNVDVQILTPYGIVNGNGGILNGFPVGIYDITYTARDECGHDTSCVVQMNVTDQLEPVAICIEILSVSLTATGTAEVNATAFDAGSYDNCCLDRFEVKRMTQPVSDYGPSIIFDCADITAPPMINVRVWDCYDNYNECMVEIEVEDKLRPVLICPRPITISCLADPFDISVTGDVTNLEVCPIVSANRTDVDNRNNCGVGTVTRTFTATDASGNVGRCTQVITLINDHPFTGNAITWPRDTVFVDDCGRGIHPDSLPQGYDYPQYGDDFCADLYRNWEDTPFARIPGVCLKLLRKWTVIDWCQYDSNVPGGAGRWEYEQEIVLMDGRRPDITCPDSLVVSVGKNCLAQVQIDTALAVDCSNSFTHTITGDFDRYGLIDNVPIGTYEVELAVTDGCNNTSSCKVPIIVRDSIAPTAICNDISVNLDTITKMAWVHARSLNPGNPDPSSTDNCTDVLFSFSVHLDDSMRAYTCADTGVVDVRLYVTDDYGNQDFCTTTITVQDNWGICDSTGSRPGIVGNIKTHLNTPTANIDVILSGMNMDPIKTDADGYFEFENLTDGDDYSVFPSCNDNFANGVTTFDIVMISQHILNVKRIDSPYQLIAADANRTGSISTLDIIALRKLILHSADDLPNQTPSWRFIHSDYDFPNPENPWQEVFPEIYNINNLEKGKHKANFIAVKIGDINGDADVNSSGAVDNRTYNEHLTLKVQNQIFEKGENIQVDFTADDFESILGYQATIRFDNEIFDLSEIIPGATAEEENFGKALLNEGILTMSWHSSGGESFDEETVLFSLVFNARNAGNLEEVLSLNGSRTRAESYQVGGKNLGVELEVENKISYVQLFQNEPNPFNEKTMIRFFLPEKMNATLSIVDVSGKVIKIYTDEYDAGTTEIELLKSDLPHQGVLYYRLQTDNFNGVKKMLLIE